MIFVTAVNSAVTAFFSRQDLCHDEAMKPHTPEMIEGPEAYTRFRDAMKNLLAVPHSVIKERIEKARRESLENPNRRGPKRKIKPSA
jgi:hypothetical protein